MASRNLDATGYLLAARVEHNRLHQRLADALRDAAVNLSLTEKLVDDVADVATEVQRASVTIPVSGSILIYTPRCRQW